MSPGYLLFLYCQFYSHQFGPRAWPPLVVYHGVFAWYFRVICFPPLVLIFYLCSSISLGGKDVLSLAFFSFNLQTSVKSRVFLSKRPFIRDLILSAIYFVILACLSLKMVSRYFLVFGHFRGFS